MKKNYRETFNIEKRPVFSKAKRTSQYTVRFGDCPLCGGEGSLMVTDRSPREWGYCCLCEQARSLHWLTTKSTHKAEKSMMLWQYWQHCRKGLNTYNLSHELRKQLGIPRGEDEPLNKYFFKNFLGVCDIVAFKYMLKLEGLRCDKLEYVADQRADMLIMPIQSSPGFIVGFTIMAEGFYQHLRLKRYEKEQGFYYPNLTSEYACRIYTDLDDFTENAAMPICMGGLFNVTISV